MGPLILAWLIGEGIVTWRQVAQYKRPPMPGQLLAVSGLFALTALLAEYEPARGAATAFAYGIDIAVLMQVIPGSGSSSEIVPAGQTGAGNAGGAAPRGKGRG